MCMRLLVSRTQKQKLRQTSCSRGVAKMALQSNRNLRYVSRETVFLTFSTDHYAPLKRTNDPVPQPKTQNYGTQKQMLIVKQKVTKLCSKLIFLKKIYFSKAGPN